MARKPTHSFEPVVTEERIRGLRRDAELVRLGRGRRRGRRARYRRLVRA